MQALEATAQLPPAVTTRLVAVGLGRDFCCSGTLLVWAA